MIQRILKYAAPFLRVAMILAPYMAILTILSGEANLSAIIYENSDHTVMQQTALVIRFIYPYAVLYAVCQFVFTRDMQTAVKYFDHAKNSEFSFFKRMHKLFFMDIAVSCETVFFCIASFFISSVKPSDVFLSEMIFGIRGTVPRIYSVIEVLLCVAIFILAKRSAYRTWFDIKNRTEYFIKDFFKPLPFVFGYTLRSFVMIFASLVLALFSNMVATLITIIKQFFVQSVIILICVILLSVFFSYIRSFFKRISFLHRLKRTAKAEGYTVEYVSKPLLSSLKNYSGYNLTVRENGKTYDCKLIPGIRRNNSMTFLKDGRIKITHEVKFGRKTGQLSLLSYSTFTDYAFDSPNKKIIILLPCPKLVCAAEDEGDKATEIDIGFDMYEYKVYAGRGFLSALEYKCVDKKYDG